MHRTLTIVSRLGLPPCVGLREVRTGDRRPGIVRAFANRAEEDDTSDMLVMIDVFRNIFRAVDH